jgi:hypothetical protein
MQPTEAVVRSAQRAFGGRGILAIQDGCWSGIGFLRAVGAEFQRAAAAAHRYERLKRAGAGALARAGILPADIPRRVFEEFYASMLNTGEDTRLQTRR